MVVCCRHCFRLRIDHLPWPFSRFALRTPRGRVQRPDLQDKRVEIIGGFPAKGLGARYDRVLVPKLGKAQ